MKYRTQKIYNSKIIGLTTDPYGNIYGYSLVFFRLIDFLQRKNKHLDVSLIANDGVSSGIVKNSKFVVFKVNRNINLLFKFVILVFNFIKLTYRYDKDTIIIANCELPELVAALILKIKFKKVYGIIQDDHVRNNRLFTIIVCKVRILLLMSIKNVIFTNRYTMNNFNNSTNKYYIENPIFY